MKTSSLPLTLGMVVMMALFVGACGGGKGGGGGTGPTSSIGPGNAEGQKLYAGDSTIVKQASSTKEALGDEVGGGSLSHYDKDTGRQLTQNRYDDPENGVNGYGDAQDYGLIGITPDHKYITMTNFWHGQFDEFNADPISSFSIHRNGIATSADKNDNYRQDKHQTYSLVVLGGTYDGKKAGTGLDYTNYGYWMHFFADNKKSVWEEDGSGILGTAFYLVSDNARKAENPASKTYKGGAVGLAYDENANKSAPLTGEAQLTVANANSGNLKLVFPNFYTMATNLTLNKGAISNDGDFTLTDKGNSGLDMNGVTTTSVNGQFFKTKAGGAEGAGRFSLGDGHKGAFGSFGVK